MEAAGKEEISVEDEAVDKNTFKDCSKIAFYRRQKHKLSTKSTYQALLDSVTTGKDSTKFQIINETTKFDSHSWENNEAALISFLKSHLPFTCGLIARDPDKPLYSGSAEAVGSRKCRESTRNLVGVIKPATRRQPVCKFSPETTLLAACTRMQGYL